MVMGCDIHLVVERRIKQSPMPDKWIAVRILEHINTAEKQKYDMNFATPAAKERNYERFAALAGVRGDGPEARGMPADASETAVLLYRIEGNHTPSWLPLSEAATIFAETEYHELTEFDRKYPTYHYFGIETETD